MEIPLFDKSGIKSMNEVVAVFAKSDLHIKKVVLLESLGLIYSDGVYDDKEKGFIKKYAAKIGLTDDDVEKQSVIMKEYLDILKRINEAVG